MYRSGCQGEENRRQIIEIDCPKCGEEGSIELFLKDGITMEAGICDACGYEIPGGTIVEKE